MAQDFGELSSTRFESTSEDHYGEWLKIHGTPVVKHRGRYWVKSVRGFYQPVNCMARMDSSEISRPAPLCWGYRASLSNEAAGMANSSIPLNMLSDLGNYTLDSLPAKRRSDFRKSERLVSFVEVTGPRLLLEQGFEVEMSAYQRTGHGTMPVRETYGRWMKQSFFDQPFQMVIAGLVDGKLGGFIVAYAIDDVVNLDQLYLSTDVLSTAIGTGLVFNFVQVCRRNPEFKHIVYGLHSIEDPRLVAFKEGMGFKCVKVPSRLWMLPGLRTLVRMKKPYAYYRLAGDLPCPA